METDYLPRVEDEAEEMEIKEIQFRAGTDENVNTSADQRTIPQHKAYTKNVRPTVLI